MDSQSRKSISDSVAERQACSAAPTQSRRATTGVLSRKPLAWLPRFRRAYRDLDTLADREQWSRSQIESYQLERLNALWQRAITEVPYYRQLRSSHGLPDRFVSLDEFSAKVPLLGKEVVRQRGSTLMSERRQPGRWHYTGGSTGTPTRVYRSRDAHLEMLRCRYRFLASWGIDIFDRMVLLWGHGASYAPGLAGLLARKIKPVEDRLRNRLRLSAYRLGRDDLRRHLQQIAAFQPAAIYAYSMAGYLLAQEAEATGCAIDSLKLVNLTAEPVSPRIVETVEAAFGVPAVQEYGSVECGFLAGEGVDRTLRVREDVALLETLPRDDGRHDIVVTVLNDPSFPLIRYVIEDVTSRPLVRPEQGFAILHDVVGRSSDLVLSATGRPIHGIVFDDIIEHQRELCRCRWRVHQQADGGVTLWLERVESDAVPDTSHIARQFEELLEGYPVEIKLVDALPLTRAGKHRFVVTDLVSREADRAEAVGSA